jgi:hypothetical protein
MPKSKEEYSGEELYSVLAEDLVQLHNAQGINLMFWPSAMEFVTHYYEGDMPIKYSKVPDWKA